MSRFFLSTFCFLLLFTATGQHKETDTLPPHLKGATLPDFKLELPTGAAYYSENLPKNKQVVIILFSPDCDHCHQLTKELTAQAHRFKKTHFVLSTTLPAEKMKAFYQQYQVDRFRNITMGKDVLYFLNRYYQSHYLPFVAIYNRELKLTRVYDGTINATQLFEQIQ